MSCESVCVPCFISICQAEEPPEGGGEASTSTRLNVENRSLRESCQNAVVLSVLLLNDPSNHRLCSLILAVGKPVKDFHVQQVLELRGADQCQAWIQKMTAGGGIMSHIIAILRKLKSLPALEACSFITTHRAVCLWC